MTPTQADSTAPGRTMARLARRTASFPPAPHPRSREGLVQARVQVRVATTRSSRLPRLRGLWIAALFVAASSLTGCRSTPASKPLDQLTAQEGAGRAVFAAQCSLCHYDREDKPLHGPALVGLFRKPYLPSGAPANDERVSNTVLHGRGNMPALGEAITPGELADLLAYLKTL